jgi:hypothetical protein
VLYYWRTEQALISQEYQNWQHLSLAVAKASGMLHVDLENERAWKKADSFSDLLSINASRW